MTTPRTGASEDLSPRTDEPDPEEQAGGVSPTVLVVDDNAGNLALARAALEDAGYTIVLAGDAEAGIAAFERTRPRCILLDILMPGMDGITACRKIRELPGGADVAIVFITAQHDVETFDRAVAAGGDDFVTKPFRPSELAVRVQTALKLRRLAHELGEFHDLIKRQRAELQRFQLQLRNANENLVVAIVQAEQLADEANAARAAARMNEERFRTLVMTSSALVWQATADGQVEVDRESWRSFTGVDAGSEAGGWLEAVHPGDRDRVRRAWIAAVATASPYACQHRLRTREGGYAWVLARAAPISTSGSVQEWIGMMTDVTDRVRAEEARERFIAILGHDLRNPLGAIKMGVESLGDLPAPQANVVARIARSAHRMEAMIRDVLDFARGRLGGGIPVAPTRCDLRSVCDEVVEEMRQAHPARAMSFDATGDLRGEWDPDRVEQVLSNLLGNAVTHGVGPIQVTIRDEGDEVVTTVHNQGLPIPAVLLPTLFEPFTRTEQDGNKAGSPGGLGLGLYIASEIVRAHGGTISVSSAQDEGTTFAISWPRRSHPPQGSTDAGRGSSLRS
jgi:PAS domain S-box-containing protein